MQSSFAAADRKPRSNIHIILHRPGIAQCKNQQDILHGRARICKPGQSRNAVRTPAARCTLLGRRPRHRRLLSIKTKDRAGILQAAGFFTKNFVSDGAAPACSAAIQRSTGKNVIFPPQNRSALPQHFFCRGRTFAPARRKPCLRSGKEKSRKATVYRAFRLFWRSKRDLNSRGPLRPYALSRGASSTS